MKRSPLALIWNIAMVYIAYWLCRVIYWAENASAFTGFWTNNTLRDIFVGAWMFDTSAIMYSNVLYAVLMLMPLPWTRTEGWQRTAKWLFVVMNSMCVIINLADAAYFQYTGRRTTSTVFKEFANENNLFAIFGVEVLRHWYLVVAGLVIITMLWRCYKRPSFGKGRDWAFYITQSVSLLLFIPLCICGMRGGATTAVRPITVSNANQYVEYPAEAAVILNTPFSILRTMGKAVFVTPDYFGSDEELERVYTPLRKPTLSLPQGEVGDEPDGNGPFNVVVIIVESFGREYIGALNETLDGGKYRGYTPFVDELCRHGATFQWSFCNGRKSIDAMPSILSSIPMFVEPFVLTPASMNNIGGLAMELGDRGYETAFFHGAENGSMGFQAFARKTGFQKYFGRTEYNADPRFNGDSDFDGTWAIWDEPFLQFYCEQMSELREPFMTAVFTASSHHPYAIPEAYRDTFPEEGIVIHKCIRYTDHALRRFFDSARRQPWFGHTLFVLTSDHTNLSDHAFYQTGIGGFCSPIIFYDPSGKLFEPGRREGIAQHIDIMPSVLGLLGQDRPYVAFGIDLFHTPPDSTWAVNYNNGVYQYAKHGLLLQFDAESQRTRAVYELADSLLERNIVGRQSRQPQMERELRAIIQQYMSRMNDDRLTPD